MIRCPKCGIRVPEQINLYNDELRKQNILMSPILPTCKECGCEVKVDGNNEGKCLLVLNGTCGSGKTTISEGYVKRGFGVIDEDCAIQSLRYKTGNKHYEWNDLLDEIISEIDILSDFFQNIVLAHIILPEDIEKYLTTFYQKKIHYKLVLLKPRYQVAVDRCQKRTCHNSITPEEWIKHFYDCLIFKDNLFTVVDNSILSVDDTIEIIDRIPYAI